MGSIKYDKDHTRQVKFKFNIKTDADILSHLEKQENTQGYIKALIRADIAAHAARQDAAAEKEEAPC